MSQLKHCLELYQINNKKLFSNKQLISMHDNYYNKFQQNQQYNFYMIFTISKFIIYSNQNYKQIVDHNLACIYAIFFYLLIFFFWVKFIDIQFIIITKNFAHSSRIPKNMELQSYNLMLNKLYSNPYQNHFTDHSSTKPHQKLQKSFQITNYTKSESYIQPQQSTDNNFCENPAVHEQEQKCFNNCNENYHQEKIEYIQPNPQIQPLAYDSPPTKQNISILNYLVSQFQKLKQQNKILHQQLIDQQKNPTSKLSILQILLTSTHHLNRNQPSYNQQLKKQLQEEKNKNQQKTQEIQKLMQKITDIQSQIENKNKNKCQGNDQINASQKQQKQLPKQQHQQQQQQQQRNHQFTTFTTQYNTFITAGLAPLTQKLKYLQQQLVQLTSKYKKLQTLISSSNTQQLQFNS